MAVSSSLLGLFRGVERTASRGRATYYQSHKPRFTPAFIRRFLLRYPAAPFYGVFILLSSGMVFPVIHPIYKWATLSKEGYKTYIDERNSLSLERQKYGTNLWFPFLGKKFDERPPPEAPKE